MHQATSDVAPYSLVASAVSGRPLTVTPAPVGTTVAYTNGSTIFVPLGYPSRETFDLVVVHASIVGAGSCQAQIVRRLKGRPRSSRRYFALEAARALTELAAVIPRKPALFAGVVAVTGSAQESLDIAMGDGPVAELPAILGEFRPKAVLGDVATKAGSAAVNAVKSLRPTELEQDPDDEEDAERSRFLEWLSSPLGGNGRLSELFASLSGASRKSGPAGSGANQDSPTKAVFGRRSTGRGVQLSSESRRSSSYDAPATDLGASYPEWNVHRRRYRENWCTVWELEPPGEGGASIEAVLLRHPLGRTRLDLRRARHESQGEELDLDAVVMARADARAGQTPDDRIFTALRRLGRNLGVLILIDASGSTGEVSSGSRTACDAQTHAAARLARTLEARGDRVAIYGFNSRGRERVYLYPIKQFHKPLDVSWQSRLTKLAPAGFTRMGAAIRHSASILTAQSGTTRQVLVVLSDGFPYDDGYEGTYAVSDTRRALSDARHAGIGCLCLSLGSQSSRFELEPVFGSAAFGHADRIEDLRTDLNGLFSHALLAAERAQTPRATRNRYTNATQQRPRVSS